MTHPASFQRAVAALRDACAYGTATAQQTADWQALSGWLDSDAAAHTEQLKTARIAFLHAADGSDFNAAHLPPPDIAAVFERLSPAAPDIARLKARNTPRPPGIGRRWGSVVGGLVIVATCLAIYVVSRLVFGLTLDLRVLGIVTGAAFIPGVVAALAAALWRGGPEFRPHKDSAIVAVVAGITSTVALFLIRHALAPHLLTPVFVAFNFVAMALPVWLLTALATWGLNAWAAQRKTRPSPAEVF